MIRKLYDPDDAPDGLDLALELCGLTAHGHSLVVKAGINDKNAGTTLFVASTDSEDRHLDVIDQKSWKLGQFRQNGPILDSHDPRRVVGVSTYAKVPKAIDLAEGITENEVGKLAIRVKWDSESPDPSIRNVGHQHMTGIRKAGSVGFRPGKTTPRHELDKGNEYYREPIEIEGWFGKEKFSGFLFEGCTLLEFSSVAIPANPDALQVERALVLRQIGGKPIVDVERLVPAATFTPEAVLDALLKALQAGHRVDELVEAFANHRKFLDWLDKRLRDPALGPIVRGHVDAEPEVPLPANTPGFLELVLATAGKEPA